MARYAIPNASFVTITLLRPFCLTPIWCHHPLRLQCPTWNSHAFSSQRPKSSTHMYLHLLVLFQACAKPLIAGMMMMTTPSERERERESPCQSHELHGSRKKKQVGESRQVSSGASLEVPKPGLRLRVDCKGRVVFFMCPAIEAPMLGVRSLVTLGLFVQQMYRPKHIVGTCTWFSIATTGFLV